MIYNHDTNKWFGGYDSLLDYFENSFQTNKIGTFKAPRKYQSLFNNFATRADKVKAINSLGNMFINALVAQKNILQKIDFDWLTVGNTKDNLREAVCNAIQYAIINNNVFERVTGIGVSAPGFSLNQDTTGWIIRNDMIGMEAHNNIVNSGIDKYKVVGDTFIGKAQTDTEVVFEWDNTELADNLGKFNTYTDGVTNTSPQRYDYFTTGEEMWRWSGAEWERVDTKIWEGRKYLVYNDYIVVGTRGEAGKDGKDGHDGKSFNVLGEAKDIPEVLLKPNPKEDDVWIVAGEMIVYNGNKWVNAGPIAVATSETKWRNIDKGGESALQTAHGEVVVLEDLSGRPIVSNLGTAAASQDYVLTRTATDDFTKMVDLKPIFIKPASSTGGHLSYQEHFGALDTQAERENFMNNAVIGKWYTFTVNKEGYQALVTGGDKTTNLLWVGFKEFDGPQGKTFEFVKGTTTAIGNANVVAPLIGEFFANTVAQPISYGALQFLPKDVIVQLINDMLAPAVSDAGDPTWNDIPGTQATLFNPSQITITLTNSGIVANEDIQLILGSTAGDLVLDETIHVYPDVVSASQNGYVAGVYKWYMYVSGTDIKFVMEASNGSLKDTTQVLSKIRRVVPRVQAMTAKYTTQQDILLKSTFIGSLAKGSSLEVVLPTGITTDTLTQIGLSVSGTTDWETVSGWDKVTPFYISVMTEDTSNTWWIEYKVEAVPGDNTKIKITNFISGNQNDKTQAYRAHWVHFKGGL